MLMRWNRSPAEIQFRLHQESANLLHFLSPPRLRARVSLDSAAPFPQGREVAQALSGTAAAAEIQSLAQQILAGDYPLLGFKSIEPGQPVAWGKDWVHGQNYPPRASRRVPYLNFNAVGDHKIIWELSRHQHLVILAQAFLLSGDPLLSQEIVRQWRHWNAENPIGRGIHWTSALEVGFRVISWCWLAHWLGPDLPIEFSEAIHQHGCYLERNLSYYFSPNTHLLGEALALEVIGCFLPGLPRAEQWKKLGSEVFAREIKRQTRLDGGYFEQSDYYHVYALDMLLLHYLLNGRPAYFLPLITRMADFLLAMTGPEGRLPGFGDDDGGRLFHPYGERRSFGRGSLAMCASILENPAYLLDHADLLPLAAWWLGPEALKIQPQAHPASSRFFPDTGLCVWAEGEFRMVADVGPFGPYQSGHSHSDTLSFVARLRGVDVLVDPGTYTYMESIASRNEFRGSAAHNTLTIEGLNQADAHNAFGWRNPPEVCVLAEEPGHLAAECRHHNYRHLRKWTLNSGRLTVSDHVEGTGKQICVTQYWQPAGEVQQLEPTHFLLAGGVHLYLDHPAVVEDFWLSPAYGIRHKASRIVCRVEGPAPLNLLARLEWN